MCDHDFPGLSTIFVRNLTWMMIHKGNITKWPQNWSYLQVNFSWFTQKYRPSVELRVLKELADGALIPGRSFFRPMSFKDVGTTKKQRWLTQKDRWFNPKKLELNACHDFPSSVTSVWFCDFHAINTFLTHPHLQMFAARISTVTVWELETTCWPDGLLSQVVGGVNLDGRIKFSCARKGYIHIYIYVHGYFVDISNIAKW